MGRERNSNQHSGRDAVMNYRIEDLQIFSTPKAETMFEFSGLSGVGFDFPGVIKTVLFIHCGLVRESQRGGKDHFEVVGRLYKSDNPRETGEDHVGKLFVRVYGYPNDTRFEASVEKII